MAKAQPYKCFGDFLYDTRIKIGLTREAATEKINEQSNSGKQIISDYSLGRYERLARLLPARGGVRRSEEIG